MENVNVLAFFLLLSHLMINCRTNFYNTFPFFIIDFLIVVKIPFIITFLKINALNVL